MKVSSVDLILETGNIIVLFCLWNKMWNLIVEASDIIVIVEQSGGWSVPYDWSTDRLRKINTMRMISTYIESVI